jgi:hypothetical protein
MIFFSGYQPAPQYPPNYPAPGAPQNYAMTQFYPPPGPQGAPLAPPGGGTSAPAPMGAAAIPQYV